MKTKHYPLLTAALGAALVLIPGILLLVVLNSGGDAETNAIIDQAMSSNTAPVERSAATPLPASPKTTIAQVASASGTMPQLSAPAVRPVDPTPVTAMGSESQAAEEPPAPINSMISEPVPVPVDTTTTGSVIPEFQASDSNDNNDGKANDTSDLIEIPRRPAVSDSYYDATGHLAMSGQGQSPDPLANAPIAVARETGEPVSKDQVAAHGNSTDDSKTKDSKRGSSRRRGKKDDASAAGDQSGDDEKMPVSRSDANPFLSNPLVRTKGVDDVDPALIQEVVINTPAENSHVNRVEDVVATTAAKGWPIALIRSDLPDDVWWVQQVIGIQGNSFGARVNFGNEHTVRGSAYRMVIVFLDSPDEVRRFRIAKQFKEIPAGVRRSREYNYIRK
jgi:hypothetical protein